MSTSGAEKAVVVEVVPAIRDGYAVLNITKIWGSLEASHRGDKLMGGMTWVPDGQLPVGIPVNDDIINPKQAVDLFSSLLETLMPAVTVLVQSKEDF